MLHRLLSFLFVTVVLCLSAGSRVAAQPRMTDSDWAAVITPLSNEDWKSAEKISLSYLNRFKGADDTSYAADILRYMYIRCVGARLAAKEYTPQAALAKVKAFKGKSVITPSLEYKKEGIFNYVTRSDEKKELFVCAANADGTAIFCFEHYAVADTSIFDYADKLEGKKMKMLARIDNIKTGGVTMPHFDISFKNADVSLDDE